MQSPLKGNGPRKVLTAEALEPSSTSRQRPILHSIAVYHGGCTVSNQIKSAHRTKGLSGIASFGIHAVPEQRSIRHGYAQEKEKKNSSLVGGCSRRPRGSPGEQHKRRKKGGKEVFPIGASA